MIRSPIGLRIQSDPDRSPKDLLREAARLGAKGVILDASGELSPDRLSETGRRDLRHTLRSTELAMIGLHLPTRRGFDTEDDLETRLARSERAMALAFDLGAKLVLARVGAVPPEDGPKRPIFLHALTELGKRADHRGVRLAIETGAEPGSALAAVLNGLAHPGLAASLDPGSLLKMGHDPVASTRDLAGWVAHAYATDAAGASRIVGGSRGFGPRGSALDWAEYLGALEEIDYRGFLTIWPEPDGDQAAQFSAIKARLDRF